MTYQIKDYYHNQKGRAFAFISQGSLSVEAAFSAPFFMLALLCMLFIFEMVYSETVMRTVFLSSAKQLSIEAYISTTLPATRLEYRIKDELAEKRSRETLIVKVDSIDCSNSYCHGDSSIMELSLRYLVKIPIAVFDIPLVAREEKLRVKGWTGYEGSGLQVGEEDTVYITDTGMVYHSTLACNYLDLSIQMVTLSEAKERFDLCSLCKESGRETVYAYITSYGTVYHNSLNCSGLTRSVYAVKKSEIHGRGGCSKCVR